MIKDFQVIIVGAGEAGLMSAIEAGKRGRKVLLLDHAKKIGEKIAFHNNFRYMNPYTVVMRGFGICWKRKLCLFVFFFMFFVYAMAVGGF